MHTPMNTTAKATLAATFALGACASPGPGGDLTGSRTAFHNPYATVERFEEQGRMDGLFYPGAGRFAFDSEGNRVRLSRRELRAMRDRAATINSTIILREALENAEGAAPPFDASRPVGDDTPAIEPSPDAPPIALPIVAPPPGPPAAAEPR